MRDPRTVAVGLDVHKASVRLAAVCGGELLGEVTLGFDHAAVERALRAWPGARVCQEAGPTGFGLHRHLVATGIDSEVVAPGLVPSRPGDRIKTDKRDARRLAALHAGGLLTAIYVPSPELEALRDLVRYQARSGAALAAVTLALGIAATLVIVASADEAKKAADLLKFQIAEEAGQYIFKSNLDSLPSSGRNVRLDITFRVPKGTSTEITAERGDISVEGLQGDQTLTSNHGDVRVSGIEGLVKVQKSHGGTQVHDVKGNVEVDGRGGDVDVANVSGTATVSGDFSGAVQFRNVAQSLRFTSSRTDLTTQRLSGRIYMEMGSLDARGVDGPFDLTTRQKDINLDGFAHSLKISDRNGEIRLRASSPPKQSIDVTSERGGIELALPEGSSFQIQADSRHGEVDSDFTGPNLKIVKEGDSPAITGSYGKGGPMIKLSTSYGTIRLARQGPQPPEAPQPPQAPSVPGAKTTLDRQHHHPSRAAIVVNPLSVEAQIN